MRMDAGQHRAIDERPHIDRIEANDPILRPDARFGSIAQCAGPVPPFGQTQSRLDYDFVDRGVGGIEQAFFPMEAQDLVAHHNPALIRLRRRQGLMRGFQAAGTFGKVDDDAKRIVGIALPAACDAIGAKFQAREPVYRTTRRVVGRKPLGQSQREPTLMSFNRKALPAPEDGSRNVARIHGELYWRGLLVAGLAHSHHPFDLRASAVAQRIVHVPACECSAVVPVRHGQNTAAISGAAACANFLR